MKERNSLGYVIGGDAGEAQLVFGTDSSGSQVSISEASRGAACGLSCPLCGTSLVAKKGEVYAHHFAHAPGSTCADERRAVESQAHKLAKSALSSKALLLPSYNYLDETGDFVSIRNVVIEEVRGAVRPDILCEVQWNSNDIRQPTRFVELAVEIKVTHAVSAEKARLYEDLKLPCIEIDLSRYRYRTDAEILAGVVSDAKRRWVWKKPPMPVKRVEWPTGPVPKNRRFRQPAQQPSEFTAEDWIDFRRRHFPDQFRGRDE